MKQFSWQYFLLHIFRILLLLALLSSIAVRRDGTLLGEKPKDLLSFSTLQDEDVIVTPNAQLKTKLGLDGKTLSRVDKNIWISDDIAVVSSVPYAKNVYGYGGNTPLYIAIKENIIVGVADGVNNETPSYWKEIIQNDILTQWIGKSLDEVNIYYPDVVSGATMSSDCVNYTILQTTNAIAGKEITNTNRITLKSILGLLVILFAVIASYFLKGKKWRTVQLILNIVILGLWCGTFVSLSLIINYLSNGTNVIISIVPFTMIILAIVLPFFGKREFYCTHVCPFGSTQELVSKVKVFKLKIKPSIVKKLTIFREILSMMLMLIMILGIGFEIINYEVFSVFLFSSASWIVISIAIVFLILSIFINRPYCRFLCPTGQILKWSQNTIKH